MELCLTKCLILGLSFVLLLFFLKHYLNYKKKIVGFPFYNILPYLIYCQVTGKISKDTPLPTVAFEKGINYGKRHMKEGLFMTYFAKPFLFIYSEEAIKFFASEKAALDKPSEYTFFADITGDGLLTSNGERWKFHRKLINPSFHMGVLKEKVLLFNQHAMAMVKDIEKLAGQPSNEIDDILKLHSFYTLIESIFGLQNDKENKEKLLKIFNYVENIDSIIVQRSIYPWLRWKFLLNMFPFGVKYLQQAKEFSDFVNNVILSMKKCGFSDNNEESKHFRKSFTYTLLKYHLNDPDTFTFKDLHDEAQTMIAAGFDTVSYSSLWCLFLLGTYAEIQENVFREIQSATSDYITYEESNNLVYLDAVIMESLRLYPTVPVFFRHLSKDVQYANYKVCKGTTIAFFSYLSQRDPKIFPDPEKFIPERFLNPEVRKSWAYIPFARGSRSCIGQNYALIEMKIFLAHIIRNFKITSLDRIEDVRLFYRIVLAPVKPLRFKITQRLSS